MSKKIIVGNWKMNPRTAKEAEKLFKDIVKGVAGVKKTEIIICSPFLYIEKLRSASRRTKKIGVGAQNAYYGDVGPKTGEVSTEMLYNFGVRYVILGHSERRAMGETNEEIAKKVRDSVSSGLSPILCVGENVRDGDHGYFNLVKNQLEVCLAGVSKNSISKVVVAYEPVWAISTTPNHIDATAKDSSEMAMFIKKVLFDKFGNEASRVRIIYGGSVNEKDAESFLKEGGVDGLLPGRASLDAKKFLKIINIAESL